MNHKKKANGLETMKCETQSSLFLDHSTLQPNHKTQWKGDPPLKSQFLACNT
jgi:hypothetical protein